MNAERLRTEAGKTARSGFFIYDIKDPANIRQVGFYDMPGYGPHRFRIDTGRIVACVALVRHGVGRGSRRLTRNRYNTPARADAGTAVYDFRR